AGEKERTWSHLDVRICAQPVVQDPDPQCIEQLSLVLVDALDLAVEDGVRIDRQTRCGLEPIRKLHFGLMFGLAIRITEALVVIKRLEPGQLVQIADPSIAYSLGNRARQRRVGDQQPASGGDAVSLIVETVREHFSEIPDRSRAEQFGMNCSNAVGAVGTY